RTEKLCETVVSNATSRQDSLNSLPSLLLACDEARPLCVHLQPRTHLLQTLGERSDLLLLLSQRLLERFHLSMLLDEFVKQHRVYFFVTDAEWLAFFVRHNEVGINFRHFLGDQSEL